jgi:uncharacterized protein YndB with AHSA1/START domain
MGEYAIRMQFDIDADADAVLDALTTTQGVASWWSTKLEGEPGEPGATLTVGFPDVPQPFEFAVERDTPRAVAWRTLDFPPWWAGTTIRWNVADREDGPGVRLHFSHEGFDPDNDVIPIITPAWAQIIGRLQRYAETGEKDPFARL